MCLSVKFPAFIIALAVFSVHAINVGEVTTFIAPDSSLAAKEIINPTDTARFVSVSVERLSSPMETGVVIPVESKTEMLFTPASLIMPGNTKEYFRFIYKGPQDDKERYYRLSWTDEPVTEESGLDSRKTGRATASATINTILVVSPRKERFDYSYKENIVTNTGNASFRVISYGPCADSKKDQGSGCRERYYIMPGMSAKIKFTNLKNKKTRIGIWHNKKYINVR